MHHNERDGITIGRIKIAEYTDKNTRSGTPALTFTTNIAHEEGIKGVKNGTLSTVSIGAIAHDVRCSICGTNIAEMGMCEHEKGEKYEDKLCYWIIKKMEPKELSYVIVPSDIYAHNLRIYNPPKSNKLNLTKEQCEVNTLMNYNPFADFMVEESTTDKTIAENPENKELETEEIKTKEAITTDEEVKSEDTKTSDKTTKEEPETDSEDKKTEKSEEGETKEVEKEELTKEEDKIEDSKEEIELLKKEIEELKLKNDKLVKQIDSEKKLRESAESELIEFRCVKKKALIEQINTIRESIKLEKEDEVVLMESSDEVLEIKLKTFKEFANVSHNLLNIQTLKSEVGVSEEKDNTNKDIKLSEQATKKNSANKRDIENMDLSEALFN